MILDFMCIVLALSTKLIKNQKYYNWVESVTVNRYLDTANESGLVINEPCEVFSEY